MSDNVELKSSKLSILPSDQGNLWNGDWTIYLKGTGSDQKKPIGRASFEGEKSLGSVPLYVELEEAYRNQGYGTQAIRMMSGWAFHHGPVYEIAAVAECDNDKAIKALEKAGYVCREEDRRVKEYSLTKAKTCWTGLYLIFGLFLGFLIGVLIVNLYAGMAAGLVICLTIGISMDVAANKEREKITGKKESKRKKK